MASHNNKVFAFLFKILDNYMAKLYTKKSKSIKEMQPSKETVSFILSYSLAMKTVKVGQLTFQNIVN